MLMVKTSLGWVFCKRSFTNQLMPSGSEGVVKGSEGIVIQLIPCDGLAYVFWQHSRFQRAHYKCCIWTPEGSRLHLQHLVTIFQPCIASPSFWDWSGPHSGQTQKTRSNSLAFWSRWLLTVVAVFCSSTTDETPSCEHGCTSCCSQYIQRASPLVEQKSYLRHPLSVQVP